MNFSKIIEIATGSNNNYEFKHYLDKLQFNKQIITNDDEQFRLKFDYIYANKIVFEVDKDGNFSRYDRQYTDIDYGITTKEITIGNHSDIQVPKKIINIILNIITDDFIPELEQYADNYEFNNKYIISNTDNGQSYLTYTNKFNKENVEPIPVEVGFSMSHDDDSFIGKANPYISKNIKLINSKINNIIGVPNGEVIIENSNINLLNLTNTDSATISNCKCSSIAIKGSNIKVSNIQRGNEYLILKDFDASAKSDLDGIAKIIYYASTGCCILYNSNTYRPDRDNIYHYMDKGTDTEPRINIKAISNFTKILDYYFAAKIFNHTKNIEKILSVIHERLGEETDITKIQVYLDKILYPSISDYLGDIPKNYIIRQISIIEELLYNDLIDDLSDDVIDDISKRSLFEAIFKEFDLTDLNKKYEFLLNFVNEDKTDVINHILYEHKDSWTDYWVSYQGASMETEKTDYSFYVDGTVITVTTSGKTSGYWNE